MTRYTHPTLTAEQARDELRAALAEDDIDIVVHRSGEWELLAVPAGSEAAISSAGLVKVGDADADLSASISAVDTTKVTDTATRTALEALKSALVGKGKTAAASGRPTGR